MIHPEKNASSLKRNINRKTPSGRRLVALLQEEFGVPDIFTFLKIDVPVNGPISVTVGTLPLQKS